MWAATWRGNSAIGVLALVALLFCLPFLVPIHRFPLTTFDSEWVAATLLAVALVACAGRGPSPARLQANVPVPVILALLLTIGGVQLLLGYLSYAYNFSSLFIFLTATFAAYLLGRWLVAADLRGAATRALSVGLLVGGLLSVVIQVLQMLDVRILPSWLVFEMTQKASSRRPFANLAQPNQLASYLAWAAVAAMYLGRTMRLRRSMLAATAVCFCGLALTGSRTGSLLGLLVLWVALSPTAISSISRWHRLQWSIAIGVGYIAGLVLTRILLSDADGTMATSIERYAEGSFGQRASMWADALRIIATHPWLGVGVGEYGAAQYWAAQADPDLLATNNPHNAILHVAAEFGVPAASAVVLLVASWFRNRAPSWRDQPEVTAALLLILIVLVHSQLEYPLWHLFFLITVGVLAGLAEPAYARKSSPHVRAAFVFAPIGIAMLCAGALMMADYQRVAAVYGRYLGWIRDGRASDSESQTIQTMLDSMNATYFSPQIERLYVDLVPVSSQRGEQSIQLVGRVLTRLADLRVIVRYIELLLQAGRIDEAIPHVARLKTFAGTSYPTLRAELEAATVQYGVEVDPLRLELAKP